MSDSVTNFLAAGIEVIGTIRFTSDMRIDGKVNGEIISPSGNVTIGDSAQITGDITATTVKVMGNVEGKITATHTELKTQSHVVGDIKTTTLSVEQGAQIAGRTEVG